MKYFLVFVLIFLLNVSSWAYISSPEGLPSASGIIEGNFYSGFSVLGDNVAGIIFGNSGVSGVGLASMIFTPLFPQAGQLVPIVSAPEGETVVYPNPFNPSLGEFTTLAFRYPQDVMAKLYIFDLSGQLIYRENILTTNRAPDGFCRVSWDGRDNNGKVVDNGVYLIQVVYEGKVIAKNKIMVLK